MGRYLHDLPDWPEFAWNHERLSGQLADVRHRQGRLLNRLLDGCEGKLTSSKWAKLTKCSQDTALRDLLELVELGILVRDAAGGRSTSYSLTAA